MEKNKKVLIGLKQKRRPVALIIIIVVIIIAAAAWLFIFGPLSGVFGSKTPKSIKIGQSKFDYPPLHYADENKVLVGFDVDLANAAAEIMGVEVEFVPILWSESTEVLESGEVDMLWGGLARASLDESIVRFTKAYLRSNIVFLMLEDRDYNEPKDLQGLSVCALNFTPAFNYLQVYRSDVIKSQRSSTPTGYRELQNALSSGEFDCMITDTSFASFFLKQYGSDIYRMSDTVSVSNYAVGVRVEDTDLFEQLQSALDELQDNGTIDMLREKWIG